jgi:hypothetical protein
MTNVKDLHDVAFDGEQDAVDVGPTTIEEVTHLNR